MHPTQGQLSPSTLRPWIGGRTPVGRHPGHIFEFLAAPPPPTTALLPSLFSAMDSDHLDTMADSRKLIKKKYDKGGWQRAALDFFFKKIVYCAMTQAKKVR